ncbi:Wzz/FepE/Etk N-terminal domain-containing protein [Pseudomonas purpurea]|uniref:LPS O-antigen chain length determinant protein WzzB n=1 Tax=Pseudomonas purpurea TaxID=3136737 RepID=UPI00326345F6
MQNQHVAAKDSDDFDLLEIFRGVWLHKWLFLIATGAVTLLSVAYAYLAVPLYEARAYIVPPTQNDITNFNYGRTKESELAPYLVKDVYAVFVRNLQSESLRRSFFRDVYLPSLGELESKSSQDVLYRNFSAALVVGMPGKDVPDRYSIVVQGVNPVLAADWVRLYVARAGDSAKQELIKDTSSEAEVHARSVEQQISSLRERALKNREDAIFQLQEALNVAGQIGLEKQLIVSGGVPADVSGAVDGRLIYLRGTKALEAEVESLKARDSDDPFISGLRLLQSKYSFYNSLKVKPEGVSVYRLDGAIETPDSPIKPRKALIIFGGLIFGMGLGVLLALGRYFYLAKRSQASIN